MKMKSLINTSFIWITCCLMLSCQTRNQLERTQEEFDFLKIKLTDNIEISKFKVSGLTDYILDIEFNADSTSFQRISEFITSQPGFFVGDTCEEMEQFATYPYLRKNTLHWRAHYPNETSFEFRRIEADCETKSVRYHYLYE